MEMKEEDDANFIAKKAQSYDGIRPLEVNSVAFIDIEILRDDKFIQFSQISCLVIKKDGESKRSFSARISPQYLNTYSHYKQSSDLLTVLGQWIDQDSKRMLVKDKEDVVEVQTERQAMAGLVKFLKHEKYILVFNSPLVLAMLREKIGSEWVDETMARAVSLESFVKIYHHPQLEVVSCDTEDLLAKVMARDPVKLENCAEASSAMYELINFSRKNCSKSKGISLDLFVLKCSSPVKSVETPNIILKHFGLDEKSLTFIEVKSSYERSVSTLIQLSYIEIHFLADEEEERTNDNLLVNVKKDERESEYAEPSGTKFFPVFDVDDAPACPASLGNRDVLAVDTSGRAGAQNYKIPRIVGSMSMTSPLSMVTQPVSPLAVKRNTNKTKGGAKSKIGDTSVGCKNRTLADDVITISDDESEAEESPESSKGLNHFFCNSKESDVLRLTHAEFDKRYRIQRSSTTVDVQAVWFNEKDSLFLARVVTRKQMSKKMRKKYKNAEYLRVSGLPYDSDSDMKGSFICKGTKTKHASYILLPHVPTSFKDNTRRNFCAIADRMKLPFVNIFTLDQVAHQKSLMLAATNRKQALAQSRKGEKLTAYEKFVAKLRMGS